MSSGIPASTEVTGALPRQIGLWSALAIVVGSVIGSGIFRSPAGIATRIPEPFPFFLVWIVGGVIAICGALTLSELGSSFPRTGGVYAFLLEGWGRFPAFLFGWAQMVIIRPAAMAAISTTFAEYFCRAAGWDTPYVRWVAAVAMVVTAVCNYSGVRWGTLLQNVLTSTKTLALGIIIVSAFLWKALHTGGAAVATVTEAVVPVAASSYGLTGFGLAIIAVLWVYDGWADLSFVAGEVDNPQRNIPRALLGGTIGVTLIYLLANLAYLSVLSFDELARSPLVAADVAGRIFGPIGVVGAGFVVVASTFGTLAASTLTGPRIIYAAAADGLLFRQLAAVHPKYQTPHVAIAVCTVLGVILVMTSGFQQMADAFVTAALPFYALSVAGLFRIRRRAGYKPVFRVPGYPVVPLLFIAAVIALLSNALFNPTTRLATAAIFGILLVGMPVYWWKLREPRR